MTIELKIPDVGESIQEVQIGRWLKHEGDAVELDENLVELETDKASLELPAPSAGVLKKILIQAGETVSVGDTIAMIDENGKSSKKKMAKPSKQKDKSRDDESSKSATADAEVEEEDEKEEESSDESATAKVKAKKAKAAATPSARRALREHDLQPEEVPHAGDRIRGSDVLRYVEQLEQEGENEGADDSTTAAKNQPPSQTEGAAEELVPMSLIRRRIAQRLVEAQQQAALLTTFNEIDMSAVIELRQKHKERFQQRYGVKLGFMSFFVKAVIDALKQFPEINAEIRGDDIAYRNYYHVGIAIGGRKGLVVPVLRHAERMSFAEIEQAIDDFAHRADQNKLKPDELQGGTFTISNGGIYGSLLSTPIVNPPQSGVLGMHAIEDRPVARGGQVVIRPMMYVALTYDHRLVDGQQAVIFLRRVKEAIEEPSRMLMEV